MEVWKIIFLSKWVTLNHMAQNSLEGEIIRFQIAKTHSYFPEH